MDILTITGLEKSFGEKEVLCGLSLSVPEHSVFGFVGRNGAGKTTTMKAVLGLVRADAGEIFVAGEKVTYGQTKTNRHIGYLPDVPEFYSYMTPREYMELCGKVCGMKGADRKAQSESLLALVGLSEERRRIKGFSRGMKQRLGIAQALLSSPKLLICDEPTSALDPVGRKEILDILFAARKQTTVLFSTHILSDVERICTDIAFLDKGKIAACGKVSELKSIHPFEEFLVEVKEAQDAKKLMDAFGGFRQAENNSLIFDGNEERMLEVLKVISENRISVQKIERIGVSLESLFLETTKNGASEG